MKQSSIRTLLLAVSLLLPLGLCSRSHAAAGDVDLSFDPGSGVNGTVNAVVVQPDGKVIIGGQFTMVKGLVRTGLARLNADGSGDSSFNAGAAAYAYGVVGPSIVLQPDGKLLVGHYYGIVRLHPDGSLDTSFHAGVTAVYWEDGSVYDAPVAAIAVQPDGKMLIGGDFTSVNGTNRSRVARLNADGSVDGTFDPGTVANQSVAAVVPQPDGKILVGGNLCTTIGTNTSCGIVRLESNGSVDGSFNAGQETYGLAAIVLQPDGKVLVGGQNIHVNGHNGIGRLHPDGSPDTSFNPGTGANGVSTIALQSNGKVLIGGAFITVNGTNRNRIARLNPDGGLDGGFNPGAGADRLVNSIVLHPDGGIFVAGEFTTFDGTSRNRIARLNADGTRDGSFHPGKGVPDPVFSLVLQPDGKLLTGGSRTFIRDGHALLGEDLTFINGTNRYGNARLNPDGSLDDSFVSNSFHPDLAFVIQPGDCSGGFDFACYQSWVARTVLVQPDGKVLVGGHSATVDVDLFDNHPFESYRSFLVRLHADGTRDTGFEPAIGARIDVPLGVSALAVQPDGKVLLGGPMVQFRRLHADGTPDNTFNSDITGSSWVASIALQADGKVLIGGDFNTVHGTNVSYGVARLNSDGSLDNSFNPGTGAFDISSVALQTDGKVLIGGSFTSFSGTPRNRIARLNADGSPDPGFNPGTGADGVVRTIALQPDGNVLIAGDFSTVNGVVRPYVARLLGDPLPTLSIALSDGMATLSWPSSALNVQLEETSDFSIPVSWSPMAQAAVTSGNQSHVIVPAAAGRKFFRLRRN